jgi:NAD(P)-dependent dehydrogenase (short-subunit alcohol dehydrogenase family)
MKTPTQVAFITGANRGIGFETARKLVGADLRAALPFFCHPERSRGI